MKFNQLCINVDGWSKACKIDTGSTKRHQLAKACEEFGELVGAYYLDDKDKIMDAVGDITVCMINASLFYGSSKVTKRWDMEAGFATENSMHPKAALRNISRILLDTHFNFLSVSIHLARLCNYYSIDIEDCFDMAWNEIKDRRLIMRDGLAVKWENMTPEEKHAWDMANGDRK